MKMNLTYTVPSEDYTMKEQNQKLQTDRNHLGEDYK